MLYLNTKTPVKDGDLVLVISYQYFDDHQNWWPEGDAGIIRVKQDRCVLEHANWQWKNMGKPLPSKLEYTSIDTNDVVFLLSPVSDLGEIKEGMLLCHLDITDDDNIYNCSIVHATATINVTNYTVVPTERRIILRDNENRNYPVKELYYIKDDSVSNRFYKSEWEIEALVGDIVEYNDDEAVVLKVYQHHDKALIQQGGVELLADISELQFVRPRAIRLGDRVVIGSYDITCNGEVIPSYNLISTKTPVYKVIKTLEKDCYILKNKETGGEFVGQACSLTLLQPREVCSPEEPTLDIL